MLNRADWAGRWGITRPAGAEVLATRRSIIELMAITAVTTLGIFATLPNTEEKIAALIAQHDRTSAVSLLEEQELIGTLTPFNAYQLANLYQQAGEKDKATAILEGVLIQDSQAGWARSKLAELYRLDGRDADEIRVLRQIFHDKPDAETRDRLVELYARSTNASGELEFILEVVDAGLSRPEDMARQRWLHEQRLPQPWRPAY